MMPQQQQKIFNKAIYKYHKMGYNKYINTKEIAMENSERIDKLEKRVDNLEITLNKDLLEIKTDLAVIKSQTSNINVESDLKNEVIIKDVTSNSERIDKLEQNQKWFVLAILGLVIETVFKLIVK